MHTRSAATPHPVTWTCSHVQWPHHTLSPGRARTCSGHTTPCHLDVHARAVATLHPVIWTCSHVQSPHHTLSPGRAHTCSGHTTLSPGHARTCSGHTTPCHLDMHACMHSGSDHTTPCHLNVLQLIADMLCYCGSGYLYVCTRVV